MGGFWWDTQIVFRVLSLKNFILRNKFLVDFTVIKWVPSWRVGFCFRSIISWHSITGRIRVVFNKHLSDVTQNESTLITEWSAWNWVIFTVIIVVPSCSYWTVKFRKEVNILLSCWDIFSVQRKIRAGVVAGVIWEVHYWFDWESWLDWV